LRPRDYIKSPALLALALLSTYACSTQDPIENPATDPGVQTMNVTPMCQVGCGDPDPHPDSVGIWIGATTPDLCVEGTDADADGLIDFCEKNLAQAFAPELKYWSADEMGREPKWAARWRDEEHTIVRVIYLFSYYRDAGSSAWVCSLPAPWWTESCFGHNGDSEVISLDMQYHAGSSHWVLNTAHYAQHDGWQIFPPTSAGYPPVEYPSVLGGYPRVWISQGKHASYTTQSYCNAGARFNADTCVDVNTSVRHTAGVAYNIGSRSVHTAAQDCWLSQDPTYLYYGSGRTECYWTPKTFRGWIPTSVGGMEAGVYSTILADQGF
jgi:hypothetical protein